MALAITIRTSADGVEEPVPDERVVVPEVRIARVTRRPSCTQSSAALTRSSPTVAAVAAEDERLGEQLRRRCVPRLAPSAGPHGDLPEPRHRPRVDQNRDVHAHDHQQQARESTSQPRMPSDACRDPFQRTGTCKEPPRGATVACVSGRVVARRWPIAASSALAASRSIPAASRPPTKIDGPSAGRRDRLL